MVLRKPSTVWCCVAVVSDEDVAALGHVAGSENSCFPSAIVVLSKSSSGRFCCVLELFVIIRAETCTLSLPVCDIDVSSQGNRFVRFLATMNMNCC